MAKPLRNLANLNSQIFDLIIVGGGIYGVCAAREAALQGLSVCLLEQNDFGSSTSSNSLKIIHGGLRYLQNLDIRRMRESIRERRAMHRLAPHLVRPLPFVIPCYGHLLRGREVMATALAINEIISADRNVNVMHEGKIPAGHVISRKKLDQLIPDLPEPGCVGGAIWYDGQARNTERLTIAFLEAAHAAGGQLFNHVEVTDILQTRKGVVGVRAVDQLNGEQIEIRSRIVLNAAGPWVDKLLGNLKFVQRDRHFIPSKGLNLVTRQIFADHAAAIPYQETYEDNQAVFDKSKLHFFIVPWKQYSLIGTRHLPWTGDPENFRVQQEDVECFAAEINRAYPPAQLELTDIYRVYSGILPALGGASGDDVQIAKSYVLIDHEETDAVPGLVTMLGVKWTTARDVAQRAVRLVLKKLSKRHCLDSSDIRLPSAGFDSWGDLLSNLKTIAGGRYDAKLIERLAESHGVHAVGLLQQALAHKELGVVIEGDGGSPTLGVEIDKAVVAEWACRLDDVILRRTELAIGGHPGSAAVERVANIAGQALGWQTADRHAQIEATERALDRLRF